MTHVRLDIIAVGIALLCLPVIAGAQTLAGGEAHTVVLNPDGTVWTFGSNYWGQLGDGTNTDRREPTQVSSLSNIVAVAAGASHTLALDSSGGVWAWGRNTNGRLGDGTTTYRTSPVQVYGLSDIVAIAAGDAFSMALDQYGQVWTWGANDYGQLGNGTTTESSYAGIIASFTGVTAIAAGAYHSLAVKSDGTAYAWGYNAQGQLGDGSTTNRTSPVQISSITDATKVAAGMYHTLVLRSDGTMKATGYNQGGRLGDGTTTDRTTLVSVSTLTNVVAIAAGAAHSLAITSGGSAYGWGQNSNGQLGDGTTTGRTSPTQATSLLSISKIGAGWYSSVGVDSNGVVYTWGANNYGQLGDGTTTQRNTPISISGNNYVWKVGTPTVNPGTGTYNSDVRVTVTVVTSGAAIHYTLNGNEPTTSDSSVTSGATVTIDQTATLKVKVFKSGMTPSTTVDAMYTMVAANPILSPGSAIYTAPQTVTMSTATTGGTIRYTTNGTNPTAGSAAYTGPVTVGTSTTIKAATFKSGYTDSGVVTYTYTMNFGTLAAPTASPVGGPFTGSVDVTLTAAIGSIYYTIDGSTPTTSSLLYTSPLTISANTTLKAKAFHPDYTASSVITETYSITVAAPVFSPTAGSYAAGQAITVTAATPGSTITYTTNGVDPVQNGPQIASGGTIIVGNFTLKAKAWKTGATASSIASATYTTSGSLGQRLAAGNSHSLAVQDDGVAWAWGNNGSGRLGDGTTTQRLLPVLINASNGLVGIVAGDSHSVGVRSDGAVYAWGNNASGQLGDGTTSQSWVPRLVSGLTSGVIAVAAGVSHSAALKGDGTVMTWGLNSSGQLGDGTTTQRLTPVAVPGLTGVVAIAARGYFTLALKGDGTVWAWGANNYGQLGDNSTTQRNSPVQVSGLANVVAVGAGTFFSIAVHANGTASGWGYNGWGQLGDESWTQRTTPVAVHGVSAAVDLSVGENHTLILNNDGSVLALGYNGTGQLGDGSTTNRNYRVTPFGLPAVVGVAAGGMHSLALTSDGTVWTWGYNGYGQLGDNTTTQRKQPAAISGADLAWSVAAPVFNTQSGLFSDSLNVTITSPDPSATIRYTTNGTTPTSTDSTMASGGSVGIGQTTTLKANAWRTGSPTSIVTEATYTLKAVTPTISPSTGSYGAAQSVTMSTTTSGATIRYTTDGSEPTSSSTTYTGAITAASTQTVKATAFKTGWLNSDSAFASYWISAGTVAAPTLSPAAGTFAESQLVSIESTTVGASIRYTLDGSTPTATSPLYEYPFVLDSTTTVKAVAFKLGYTASSTTSGIYAIDASGAAATPTLSPGGGMYATNRTVTVTGETGATLRYTTNGSSPAETDTVITSGNTVAIDRSTIFKVRAWKSGSTPSVVRRADYVITGAIAAGAYHSLALKADGTLWAWGRNDASALGDGTTTDRLSPVQVLTGVASMAAGPHRSVAVKSDGTVWSWGVGASSPSTPTQVSATGFTSIVAAAVGASHYLALKSDGTVWAWGTNTNGQIGDGTTTTRSTAIQVPGLSGVTAIAAAGDVSFAIGSDGASTGVIWAWGKNNYGQLGDGSTLTRTRPVIVGSLSSVQSMATGGDWALALKSDGTVWAWGVNTNGVLGVSTSSPSTTPFRVQPLSNVVHIAAGTTHALAITNDGRLWGWGNNDAFQLSIINYLSSTTFNWVPQIVPNIEAPISIAGGTSHSLVIKADGSVWAFGTGKALGDGVGSYSKLPTDASDLVLATNTLLNSDTDGDGLIGWREYLNGTDPINGDTNGNGLSDGVEAVTATDGNNPDTDADGVPNWLELQAATDPFNADTDDDSVNDKNDAFPLDPSRSSPPTGNPNDTTPPTITLTEPTYAVPVP